MFLLSGDLVPSHQSIHFAPAPLGSFWRCFHLIISLKKFFFFFFPGQYKVTDHISAAFWLSDHLIKLRSILPPVFVDHLFFLGLRGEASGLSHTNPIPAKAFEVELVTCTNSQGFRAWLSVPYSHIVSPGILLYFFFFLNPCLWHQQCFIKYSIWRLWKIQNLSGSVTWPGLPFLPSDTFTLLDKSEFLSTSWLRGQSWSILLS